MDKLIYLDNNATTKTDEKVLEVMMPYFKEEYANPSSMYDFSKKSSRAIKEARGKLKDFFNASNENEIIFTSCGSESANTAIRGVLASDKTKKHIITTQIEHPCVLNVYKYLEKQGYNVDYIGVNSNGELNLDQLRNSIKDDTALVSVMWANNETGVLNPIGEISQIIKSKNVNTKFFVDGVQAAGKVPIDVQEQISHQDLPIETRFALTYAYLVLPQFHKDYFQRWSSSNYLLRNHPLLFLFH